MRAAAHGLAAHCTRALHRICSSENRGRSATPRGERATLRREPGKPGARSTRSPCAKGRKHTAVTTVAPAITRLSPRNGFNGFLRALPGDEFLLSPSSCGSMARRARLGRPRLRERLGISDGCQDHTTSPSALASFVLRAGCSLTNPIEVRPAKPSARASYRVHRIPTRVRDDLEPPLVWVRQANLKR